jgi:hypothetical protein
MRVSSLVILVLVVAGAGYVFLIRPPWVQNLWRQHVKGYAPASTPTEAVDRFIKAVKDRDLESAATYCNAEYAALLKRGAAASAEMGAVIDKILEYGSNSGLATDKCIIFLSYLDAFPTNIKMTAAPKEKGDIAIAVCQLEVQGVKGDIKDLQGFFSDLQSVDGRMFTRALMSPALINPRGFELTKEGDAWKLKIPVPDAQVQAADYYISNYKAYHTGLTVFRRDVTNERYASKTEFERELLEVLQEAK